MKLTWLEWHCGLSLQARFFHRHVHKGQNAHARAH